MAGELAGAQARLRQGRRYLDQETHPAQGGSALRLDLDRPYRDLHPELDAYRAQSAGRALFDVFAQEVHSASGYWIERAAENAGKSGEEWLFIPQVMHADGWRRTEKQKRPVWTKVHT